MRQLLPNLFAVALLAACGVASAADTTTFNVKLLVTKACTITAAAATDVDFGSQTSTTTGNVDQNGGLTVQCTPLTPYTIALNAGANASTGSDVTTRRMKNVDSLVTTNNYVGYQLYSNLTHTSVWGTTTNTNTVAGTGLGINQTYTIYGRITNLAGNNPATGNYQDTVTATITY
jgi:spore coat protein U-like protein